MFLNVVIGKPLVDPKTLLALDDLDWKNNEQPQIAFWDGKSRGTASMIDLAHRYNLRVRIVRYKQE